jgi:hypothetical protein
VYPRPAHPFAPATMVICQRQRSDVSYSVRLGYLRGRMVHEIMKLKLLSTYASDAD